MKSVPQLTGEIMSLRENNKSWDTIDLLIREWGHSIVDRCADKMDVGATSAAVMKTIKDSIKRDI